LGEVWDWLDPKVGYERLEIVFADGNAGELRPGTPVELLLGALL